MFYDRRPTVAPERKWGKRDYEDMADHLGDRFVSSVTGGRHIHEADPAAKDAIVQEAHRQGWSVNHPEAWRSKQAEKHERKADDIQRDHGFDGDDPNDPMLQRYVHHSSTAQRLRGLS